MGIRDTTNTLITHCLLQFHAVVYTDPHSSESQLTLILTTHWDLSPASVCIPTPGSVEVHTNTLMIYAFVNLIKYRNFEWINPTLITLHFKDEIRVSCTRNKGFYHWHASWGLLRVRGYEAPPIQESELIRDLTENRDRGRIVTFFFTWAQVCLLKDDCRLNLNYIFLYDYLLSVHLTRAILKPWKGCTAYLYCYSYG